MKNLKRYENKLCFMDAAEELGMFKQAVDTLIKNEN